MLFFLKNLLFVSTEISHFYDTQKTDASFTLQLCDIDSGVLSFIEVSFEVLVFTQWDEEIFDNVSL